METKPAIRVNSLSKSYLKNQVSKVSLREEIMQFWGLGKGDKTEIFNALSDISFDVDQGEVLGIIGPNGAGKSTLLKILSKITVPDNGSAVLQGRVSSLLEVGMGFHRELSGRENIYLNGLILGMTRAEVKEKEAQIIDFSGVEKYIDTPLKHYSSGMGVRLAFSVAAHLNADILLIDEVLAVGDAEFQTKCLNKMQSISNDGRTVIFVSHQLNVVQQLCNRCILLQQGKIIANGDPKTVVSQYLERLSINNEAHFPSKPLSWVKAKQDGSAIMIEAEYAVDMDIKVPSLGFVIYDAFGQPITGANPMMTNDHLNYDGFNRTGKIKVNVTQPLLMDGTYFLSIWFGINGYINMQSEDKCISFMVSGMSKLKKKTSTKEIGSAACTCEFEFS